MAASLVQSVKKVSEGRGGVKHDGIVVPGEPSGFPTPRNNHPPAGVKSGGDSPTFASACQRRRRFAQAKRLLLLYKGEKRRKSREKQAGKECCHVRTASFLRFMAANLSVTHCVTRAKPR